MVTKAWDETTARLKEQSITIITWKNKLKCQKLPNAAFLFVLPELQRLCDLESRRNWKDYLGISIQVNFAHSWIVFVMCGDKEFRRLSYMFPTYSIWTKYERGIAVLLCLCFLFSCTVKMRYLPGTRYQCREPSQGVQIISNKICIWHTWQDGFQFHKCIFQTRKGHPHIITDPPQLAQHPGDRLYL